MAQSLDPKYMWNLSKLYAVDTDPKMEADREWILAESTKFITKWRERTDYLEQPTVLAEALREYDAWQAKCGTGGDLGYYWWLRSEQEEDNKEVKAEVNKLHDFEVKIVNDIQFFELRIAKIPADKQQAFLSHPLLADYRHFLETAFAEAKYQLSEPEEKILNLKAKPASFNWQKMLSSFLAQEQREVADEKGQAKLRTYEELLTLLSNKQKSVRDAAAAAMNEILAKFIEVGENEINSLLENKKIDDELRGLPRPDAGRHISDDIDTDVVDAMLDAVVAKFPIAHRYYKLKAALLKQPRLGYHEKSVETGAAEKQYTFEEAYDLTNRVLSKLDPEFAEILNDYRAGGQFDVFPRKGKSGGAFCAHNLISQPTYILLNYTDQLRDITTIAHEMGHGINNEFIKKAQNAINFGTPMATAEVASTFMEDFVLEELMHEADDELRFALIMSKLNDDVSSIFRQVACYKFEQELHETFRKEGYLAQSKIGEMFSKHMQAYLGDYVDMQGYADWWLYWSHIRSFFYVYSYASGLLISKSLQSAVRADPTFIEKVKEFLSAGLSDSPKNIFMKLGIDITDARFWDQGLGEVDALLNEAEELARKLGKI